jgi:hypothetical protein
MSKTICKDCIFAKYEDVTQIGCNLNRLDVFRKNNIEVTEYFDAEKEFFGIDGFCFFHRSKEWLSGHTIEEAVARVNEDSRLRYTALIWTDGNLDDVSKTIDSLLSNPIPPKRVIVLNRFEKPILTDKMLLMLELKNIPFKLQNPTELMDLVSSVDLAVHNLDTPAYLIIPAGSSCGAKDITKINDRLNLGNFIFSIIEYNGNIKLVNYKIHKLLNGNHFGIALKDKIISEEKKNEWPQTIFQFSRLEEIEY